MGNKAANQQINAGQTDKTKFQGLIDNFSYSNPDFQAGLSNPYANVTNTGANLGNPFAGQQVALQAADYQRQATDTNLANTLDAIAQSGGNAGASATALARQSSQSQQQIAAGIQQQEQQINQASAQQQAKNNELSAQLGQRAQQLRGSGQQFLTQVSEARAQAELAGLGNAYAGAQQTINAGYQAKAANTAALIGAAGNVIGGVAGGIGAAGGAASFFSDHRLKENIEFDRFSPKGVGIYRFNYKGKPDHKFEGALSIGVPDEARIKNFKGSKFDGVDYNKIDVELKLIK